MQTLTIVGNAPLQHDFSDFIDSSDCVVRFNTCKRYGGNSGTKTDILVLNNTGDPETNPTLRFLLQPRSAEEVQRALPYLATVKQVWFVRPPPASLLDFIRERIPDCSPFKEPELRCLRRQSDLAADIAQAQRIPPAIIKQPTTAALHAALWDKLLTYGPTEAALPSTGMLGVELIVGNPRFSAYKVFAAGFNWNMWPGHPGALERALMTDYSRQGRLTLVARRHVFFHRIGRPFKSQPSASPLPE